MYVPFHQAEQQAEVQRQEALQTASEAERRASKLGGELRSVQDLADR